MTLRLKIPISNIHERIEYEVYQGGKVIKRGDYIGKSFTTLGKNRLAGMLVNNPWMTSARLTTYRVLVNAATWYSSAATVVSFNRNAGTITAATQEFDGAGEYKRLQGSWNVGAGGGDDDVDSYYHYVTTSLTIGAGQTVKFFVEYQFSGLGSEIAWGGAGSQNSGNYPSVVGDIVCAAVLFDFAGDSPPFNEPIGSIVRLTENAFGSTDYGDEPGGEKFSRVLTGTNMTVSNNYILISGIQHSVDWTHGVWWLRVLTSHATFPKVFHEWSVSGDGDADGPFHVVLQANEDITVQTDIEFTFG